MRLGKVKLNFEYIVDLDNQLMFDHAQDVLIEDVLNAIKYDEVENWIKVEEDNTLTDCDIPEFLKEEHEV